MSDWMRSKVLGHIFLTSEANLPAGRQTKRNAVEWASLSREQ